MIEILFASLLIIGLGMFVASAPRCDYWTGGALVVIGLVLGTVALVAWWDAARTLW